MQKSAISQKLPPQILFILHQNTCFGPYFNIKYWFFRELTKKRLILWISTQDGQNRHEDSMMVQKGPNGPETLLTCIIHNYRSYWPALGLLGIHGGPKGPFQPNPLSCLAPILVPKKNLPNIGMWPFWALLAVLSSFGRFGLFWAILGPCWDHFGPFLAN